MGSVVPVDIRPIQLTDAAALASAYEVECESTKHDRPAWVPLGDAARIAAWRAQNGWLRRLVGAYDAERLVGFATSLTADDTPGTSWIDVAVRPSNRGRGVGAGLARAAEKASPDQVRQFVASAYRPTSEGLESLLVRFAEPLGYERATTETVVELDLSAAHLTPVEPRGDYTVSSYLDGVPERFRDEVGVLKGLVDAEAPHGDLDWQPTPVSAEEYQAEIELWREQGRTAIESIALDHRGTVVAWTCLVVAATSDRPAQIEGTLVRSGHRGHRLGASVKKACLVAAREHGRATRVRTSSDDGNTWMRAINEELGFLPVESEALVRKRRGEATT
jgi:GNAT superfamily N-acetyltransferase